MEEVLKYASSALIAFISAYFALKQTAIGYSKDKCKEIEEELKKIKSAYGVIKTNNKIHKQTLKSLLRFEELRNNTDPMMGKVIKEMLELLENETD